MTKEVDLEEEGLHLVAWHTAVDRYGDGNLHIGNLPSGWVPIWLTYNLVAVAVSYLEGPIGAGGGGATYSASMICGVVWLRSGCWSSR